MNRIYVSTLTTLFLCAIVLISGCGREAATPDKLYGIWMGDFKKSGKVSYTFILGGKCEIDYPKSNKPIEKAKWKIQDGSVIVERTSGETETFTISEFDLKSDTAGVSVHKLGMEY